MIMLMERHRDLFGVRPLFRELDGARDAVFLGEVVSIMLFVTDVAANDQVPGQAAVECLAGLPPRSPWADAGLRRPPTPGIKNG